MRNSDVIALLSNGLMEISTHSLEPKDAYQVYKFKKALIEYNTAIKQAEMDILKECGISDVEEFNKQLLAAKDSNTEEYKNLLEKVMRFNSMRDAIYSEEITFDITPLSYEAWKKLQDENAKVIYNNAEKDVFSGITEVILENILWSAPE